MLNVEQWTIETDRLLKQRFAISISDIGFDDEQIRSYRKQEPIPHEFVDWFAIKYDLEPVSP